MRERAIICGLGRIGWRFNGHETHYAAIQGHPLMDFAGGVDVDDGARKAFQTATAALVYPGLASALVDALPSIVTVATPPATHADLVCEAAAFPSVKAILCEKPMAESVRDCRRMIDACRGKVLIIGHQRRYEQRHRLLRAFLKSGAIGNPVAGACYFSGDYLNNGTHAADTMRFLLGDGPWSIYRKTGDIFNSWVSTEHGAITLFSRGNLEPGYMRAMYDNLLECIGTDQTPECSGEDGMEAVRLALAAKEAHEQAA